MASVSPYGGPTEIGTRTPRTRRHLARRPIKFRAVTVVPLNDEIALADTCDQSTDVLIVDLAAPERLPAIPARHLSDYAVATPRIILLTDGDHADLDAVQAAWGAVAVLTKPVDGALLHRVVRAVIAGPGRASSLEHLSTLATARRLACTTVRCPRCRWLLYLGGANLTGGIVAGRRDGDVGMLTCPGCGQVHALRAPANGRATTMSASAAHQLAGRGL